jgi:hypothetical protein
MAGELGFEPRLTESESAVLPLNYSPPNARQYLDIFRGFTILREKFYKFAAPYTSRTVSDHQRKAAMLIVSAMSAFGGKADID